MTDNTTELAFIDPNEQARWYSLAETAIKIAKENGATAAEIDASKQKGLSVAVRLGEVETVEYHRDQGFGITVYFGHQKGSASTSDLSLAAIKATVAAACDIARVTGEDNCAGLADAELIAKSCPDLDLYHPWYISPEQAIEIAMHCEGIGREADPRIINSEGASLSTHEGFHVYANSYGFVAGYPTTRHSFNCSLIGQMNDQMERDFSYTVARSAADLDTPEIVAKRTAERTLRRLGARRLTTRQAPVIFEADIAGSLLSHFTAAIRGSSLYRKCTFLLNHLGKQVFSSNVNIREYPHLLKGLGSAPFDNDGIPTAEHDFIKNGILENYVLSTYSARKLGLQPTGNAGGVYNLAIEPGPDNLVALLKKMDTGLLVTELMGQGVNILTGDYSRGAAGFWVENGIIQYPVHEITIAGNLRDMFLNLAAVGNDVEKRGNIRTGSILLERMTIGGE